MKYYIIQQIGSNIKETGTQFQSIDGIMGDIQQNFMPFEGKINFPFKLPTPFLQTKAKPTTRINVVMIPSWFQVFKANFIEFLKNFKIQEFQTWQIIVHHKNLLLNDYFLLYLPNSVKSEIICFKESEFNIGKWSDWNFLGAKLEIENEEDFSNFNKEFKETDHYIKPNLLNLNFSNINEDFFRVSDVPLISGHYFVSQKLKNAIEKERYTGFSFQEIEQMDNRIKVTY